MTGHATMQPSPTRINYDGRRFRSLGAGRLGAALAVPTGYYHQDGDLVWVEIVGGPVRIGRLVGRCRPDGTIDAGYCQLMTGGEVVAGTCVSTPTVLDDGRVQLQERWQRIDGSSGVSWIEEVPVDERAGHG